MSAKKIALIGCGSIGNILSRAIKDGSAGRVKLVAVFDLDREKAEKVAGKLSASPRIADGIKDIIEDDSIELVIEAASQEAVSDYIVDVLRSKKDFMALSIGAFSNGKLLKEAREAAKSSDRKIYLPSGAILGLDGIQAAKIAGIKEAVLKTRKPPETLAKTKFVREKEMDLSNLREPKEIFEGPASEAVKAFPESVNVAASVSLAGKGFAETVVKIIADPSLDQNVHHIEIKGEAGEFTTESRNFPSPQNPKTSYLAALSAIAILKKITQPVRLGT